MSEDVVYLPEDPIVTGKERPCRVCGQSSKTIEERVLRQDPDRWEEGDPFWHLSARVHVDDGSKAERDCTRAPAG